MPGGFRVKAANGITVAWVYARDDMQGTGFNRFLDGDEYMTSEEAWKIASNIAKLPALLKKDPPPES